MRVRQSIAGLTAVTALALTGCGGGTPTGSPTPAASESAASTPAASSAPSGSPSTSPSSTLSTLPADQCLTGEWTLVRFVATRDQTYGTGQGGDVRIAFDDGKDYTLTADGKKPISLTLGGNTGTLTVDGKADGTYALDGSTATFTADEASGSGTVTLGGGSRRLPMDQVLNVIGLKGDGQVACTTDAMTITLSTVRLELGRV